MTMSDLDMDLDLWASDVFAHTHLDGRKGHTRRRFLQGVLAAGGIAAAGLPTWLSDAAAGAVSPLGPTDGVLCVVMLLGGNDGLNTLAPISGTARGQYEGLRPKLGLAASSLLPVGDGTWGLHPLLPKLAGRVQGGTAAVVQGVGTNGDGSHFSTRKVMMSGTAGTSRTTGWLGRYADGLSGWDTGFSEVSLGGTVPLNLVGSRVEVTALPSAGTLWGSDTTTRGEQTAYAAIRAMSASPSGLGALADRAAAAVTDTVNRAGTVSSLYTDALPAAPGLVRDMTLAARTINADLGTRIVSVDRDGFDTHANQLTDHGPLLTELDDGIEAFFSSLTPSFRKRATVLVVSEFGRRPAENGSAGTDHGTANLAFVVGDNVKGGVYGDAPSLTSLDPAGNLVPTVDVREVYGSVLGPWLDGDPTGTLGASYGDLGLFSAGPGQAA
jgi:uncharacterized protein (DUF1501 family)